LSPVFNWRVSDEQRARLIKESHRIKPEGFEIRGEWLATIPQTDERLFGVFTNEHEANRIWRRDNPEAATEHDAKQRAGLAEI
jgi:hypothetical protein